MPEFERSEQSPDQNRTAPDDNLTLWGRDMDREDFLKGHYGDSRHTPTPEGGQAGIAQGNTEARGLTTDETPRRRRLATDGEPAGPPSSTSAASTPSDTRAAEPLDRT